MQTESVYIVREAVAVRGFTLTTGLERRQA
jgi:hypothetical protein